MTYQWNRKVSSINTPILGATGSTLTVSNASAANVGTYNVSVINAYGTKLSQDAALMLSNRRPVANSDAYNTPKNTAISNGVPTTSGSPSSGTSLVGTLVLLTTSGGTTDSATVNNPTSVLANDSDDDGDSLTAVLVSNVSHGLLNFYSNGTFNYTPNTNFIGNDSFTYVANDGQTNSLPATVNLTITDNASPIQPATANTLPATNLLSVSAMLNAFVNPNGSAATYYFQYGQTTNYGLATSPKNIVAGTNEVNVFNDITGLIPGTSYHFSIVVNSPGGLTVGNDRDFTTPLYDTTTLVIRTNGFGYTSPPLDDSPLIIGQTYLLTASPAAAGVVFTGWKNAVGSLVSTNPTLTFIMASNLTLVANFVDAVKPTLSITNVPSAYVVSNAWFTVIGLASDNVSIGNVFYSFNKTEWLSAPSANSWSNWSAPLALNPGTNTFSAYALDVSGNYSATTSVTIIHVPVAVLAVSTNGSGSIAPVLNGAVLRLGQNYTLTASPATGFMFTNWVNGNGIILTNRAALTFIMTSNLSLIANFVDITKPVLTLTSPAASTANTNRFILVSGKVTDNGLIAGVYFRLNNTDWYATSTTNNWTNWNVVLELMPGTNTFSAYAMDAAGNASTTNSINLVYTTSLNALTGLKAVLTTGEEEMAPIELAFAAATFSQKAHDTNNFNCVGSYTYTKLNPNSATLKLTFTAPPSSTNDGPRTLALNFTAPNLATYSNVDNSLAGLIQFSPATTLAPASLANQSVIFVGTDGQARSNVYAASTYVSVDLLTRSTNRGTSYTYTIYSPVAALLKETDTNGLTYKVVNFVGTNYGTSAAESYGVSGVFKGASLKFFGLASQRAGGNAPTNLNNRSAAFDTIGSQFTTSFATNTFAQFSPTLAYASGVGSYNYGRITNNLGSLSLAYSAPGELAGGTSSVKLQFFAPNLAVYTNTDGTVGHAIFGATEKLAPATLAGAVIGTTNYAGANPNQFTFNEDNSFVASGFLNLAGTFAYAVYAPESALVQLNFTAGDFAGSTGALQLDYDTAAAGRYRLSIFDSTNTLIGTSVGGFGQQ